MAEKRYAVLIGGSKYSDKSGLQNLHCPNFSEGDKTSFIRAANLSQTPSVESVTVSLGPDLLSLSGPIAADDRGGPLLNQQGQVTGIIVEAKSSQNADAAKATHIRTLLNSKPSTMSLMAAGANAWVFDYTKKYSRNNHPSMRFHYVQEISTTENRTIIDAAFNDANLRQLAKVASRSKPHSFTDLSMTETAYLVDSHAGSYAESWGPKAIVIMAGDTPTRVVDAHTFFAIKNSTDLNGDGVYELLLIDGHAATGEIVASLSLTMIGADGLEVLANFDGVEDRCDMSSPENQYVTAWALYSSAVTSGRWPEFRLDKYVCKCKDLPNGFTYVSSSAMTIRN